MKMSPFMDEGPGSVLRIDRIWWCASVKSAVEANVLSFNMLSLDLKTIFRSAEVGARFSSRMRVRAFI